MPWNQKPLQRLIRRVAGRPLDERTPHERFRDEALPNLPVVMRFALSLTRDESDAEDLTQETFLRAFRSWHQFIPGTECRAWLFAICRNTWIRESRREPRVVAHEDAELEALGAAALHAAAKADGLDDMFSRIGVMDAVRAAVEALPNAFREAVVLVDIEDLSYDEAARILDVPKGTVRSRLYRGRRMLHEGLIEHARDAGLANEPNPAGPEGNTTDV